MISHELITLNLTENDAVFDTAGDGGKRLVKQTEDDIIDDLIDEYYDMVSAGKKSVLFCNNSEFIGWRSLFYFIF